MTYLESLYLMRTADALVLIEADIRLNLFVPSKLSDYIGARRPIIGLAPPGGSYDLLTKIGAMVVSPADIGGIAEALNKTLSGIASGAPLPYSPVRDRLATRAIASELEAILDRVTK